MSLTRGLIIKSGRPMLSQFSTRPLLLVEEIPPVQNVWYEFMPLTSDVRGLYMSMYQENAGANIIDIEFEVTVDGVLYEGDIFGATSGVAFYIYLSSRAEELWDTADRVLMGRDTEWFGHTMSSRVRMISVVGAGQILRAFLRYEQL